jgi:hypothetical protein
VRFSAVQHNRRPVGGGQHQGPVDPGGRFGARHDQGLAFVRGCRRATGSKQENSMTKACQFSSDINSC